MVTNKGGNYQDNHSIELNDLTPGFEFGGLEKLNVISESKFQEITSLNFTFACMMK